jgi:hypothetical protein
VVVDQKEGVAKKHDFRGIQRKIPQISNFAEKRDSNPPPHGGTAADIAKIRFRVEKHDFCNNPIGFSRNSPDYIPKIGFSEKLFSRFSQKKLQKCNLPFWNWH